MDLADVEAACYLPPAELQIGEVGSPTWDWFKFKTPSEGVIRIEIKGAYRKP